MTEKQTFAAIGGVSLLIIVAASFLLPGKPEKTAPVLVASYSASDTEKPKAEADRTSENFGAIKVSDEKTAQFAVKNAGSKPLQLSRISSSCMCTFGQIVYNGKTSEEFGMHDAKTYVAEIAPGTQATLKVIYRPYLMPVYGAVEREVYVMTNDPAQPQMVFKVSATVQ